jgi:hypothetical protein
MFCQKIYIEIRKQKKVLYWVLEMSTAFSDTCIDCFPHVWCNLVKSSCSDRKRFTRRDIVDLFSTGQSGNASQLRTRCQVVFDNEHSLRLCKIHTCTSTVWRQITDWCEQVTTWRDLRGLLYSHSDTVCLLIQLNYTELQPLINILIWVAWLSITLYNIVQGRIFNTTSMWASSFLRSGSGLIR